MKYATEMGSAAMTCMPSFTKIGSGIQKLMWCGLWGVGCGVWEEPKTG
jgi:hypothetical protein